MEISGSFSDYLNLMLGKPRIRLNNLKTSLGFPCLGLNPIIICISPMDEIIELVQLWKKIREHERCFTSVASILRFFFL